VHKLILVYGRNSNYFILFSSLISAYEEVYLNWTYVCIIFSCCFYLDFFLWDFIFNLKWSTGVWITLYTCMWSNEKMELRTLDSLELLYNMQDRQFLVNKRIQDVKLSPRNHHWKLRQILHQLTRL